MFKLNQHDIKKIIKGLSYLMDDNNSLHFIEGNRQTLLRLEIAETDSDGEFITRFSGVEFTLDNSIPEELYLHNSNNLISNLKNFKEASVSIIDNDSDGSTELEVTYNRFKFSTLLNDNKDVFRHYANDDRIIKKHKSYLKNGLINTLEDFGLSKLSINLPQEEFEFFKKMKSIESVMFDISGDTLTITGVQPVVKDTYTITLPIENNKAKLFFILPLNRLTKIEKSNIVINIYHQDSDVGAVVFHSEDSDISYILPLLEE